LRRHGITEKSDERILGNGEFVDALLEAADENTKRQVPLNEMIDQARNRVSRVCKEKGIDVVHPRGGNRRRGVSAVRAQLAVELTIKMGLSLAETARQLGVSTSAIAKIVERNQ
ncbi:MAG: hypothetical protein ABIL58_17295, partial [Pseudomonadota bacterium]